jgi:hypothetical protein
MSEMQNVIASLSGNLNTKDKRWLSAQINKIQAHESKMAMMKWLAEDPEAKYYAGVILGSATAVAGAMISGDFSLPGQDYAYGAGTGNYSPGATKTKSEFKELDDEDKKGWLFSKKRQNWTYVPEGYAMGKDGTVRSVADIESDIQTLPWWAGGPTGMAVGYAFSSEEERKAAGFPTAENIMGVFNNAFSMVGAGFAGFCAAVLLLKAIFGEDGLSQLPFSGGIV